ncbi:CDP-glycerol glycerophosphotransferase family protein [Leucobacter sp. HNU]|uniref:CDP-glycerol glycerophosphotransferase family protein n=1 Tax=Leucobacter sp. HNU TaxID=3236805 RepID=UPI003A8099F8
MSSGGFGFARGNLEKVLAIPKYAGSLLLSWFIPRIATLWVFGSGIGVGEGALALARELRRTDPSARIIWLVADDSEAALAESEGFRPVHRRGRRGFWATLRAGRIVVTHGLGDANRFGVFGGRIIQLWHGAPLKRLHLDSPVTTRIGGPAPVRILLRRMYEAGAKQVALYVAGSVESAERLRSAFRVDPGRVQVLGDPRDDALAEQRRDPAAAAEARARVLELLRNAGTEAFPPGHEADLSGPLVLYAPTWRDGDPDPAIPDAAELAAIRGALERLGAHLVIRSHPLGAGAYSEALGGRIHGLGADLVRDITPLLGAFDAVITDYSSIAIDFSLLSRPIVWFAPDLEAYAATRGLYEPLEVTASGRIERTWRETLDRLSEVLPEDAPARRGAVAASRALADRFHAHPEGGAATRVLAAALRLSAGDAERIPDGAVFFESFYGRQVTCNPLALDREIASRFPEAPRFWSVTSERQTVPAGATPLLVGSADWFAARRRSRLLVVNDWLRFRFRRGRHQTVLQTWHGTMLKHLALGRPNVGLRTRIAIRRESRRWSVMLSHNPHSTEQFRRSYAFRGEILETGYPRDDRLAASVVGDARIPLAVDRARRDLGIAAGARVLVYAPTWRDSGVELVDELDVRALADELGDGWIVAARGHTRTHGFGRYGVEHPRVLDVSRYPDVNDVLLAADLLVTDYSSIMFDAAVARVPMAFFVPDLASYRDRERGFTFDFEERAPGPLLTRRDEVVACAREIAADGGDADWVRGVRARYDAWCASFVPHDDGGASARVVDALVQRGALG